MSAITSLMKTAGWSRREFLRRSAVLGGVGLGLGSPWVGGLRVSAAPAGGARKLLFIFQRGGNDGINTVIPRGDAEYNAANRPTLFLPEAQCIDLGNGFAQLHPRMQPMMEIFDRQDLTGREGPGQLAVLHRIGYSNQSRSHFESQDFWENGSPGNAELREGVFYRLLAGRVDLDDPANGFSAASISSGQLRALQGRTPFPNFYSAGEFDLRGDAAARAKFLGTPGEPGTGLRGLYGGAPSLPDRPYSELVHRTGGALGTTLEMLREAAGSSGYSPEGGAVYPQTSFGNKLQEAALLLKRTPVQVVGVNLDGWDTHAGQGPANGYHGDLLRELAQGFQALYRDLQDQWDDMLVVTMTEFGRTSQENGSEGTDHAEATVMFAAGGGVRGGVYNCDAGTWKTGDLFSQRGRYLARRTDFRAVFGEIFTRHFGDEAGRLPEIMPGYPEAAEDYPGDFESLGFLG